MTWVMVPGCGKESFRLVGDTSLVVSFRLKGNDLSMAGEGKKITGLECFW